MRIREPGDALLPFLVLWAGLFGGIPTIMLLVSPKGVMPVFLLLFPAVAATVFGFGLRRQRRSGFLLTAEGLTGAHDAEADFLPWSEVERLLWQVAPDTSGVRVNDRPQPPGDALFAQHRDGRRIRVMQRVARSAKSRRLVDDQLARAVVRGLLPVPVHEPADATEVPPAQPLEGPGTITWRSTGPDELYAWAPPPDPATVSAPAAVEPPPPPSAWPTGDVPPVQAPADEPFWPSADDA